jgi:transcriptional antiterminator Rof (Rho-off)
MSETKQAASAPRKRTSIRYALSIHMKYGEVLHAEGLTKEEKDEYFGLAKQKDQNLIVEDNASVRNLRSEDIAKISAKAYDTEYEKVAYPVRKMLFSESTIGRKPFVWLIKAFVIIAVLGILGFFGLAMVEGNIVDVFFDPAVFSETILKGIDFTKMVFNYIVIFMVLLSLIDIVLGLRADYYINQDGVEPVDVSRLSNLVVTVVFIVVFMVVRSMLAGIVALL